MGRVIRWIKRSKALRLKRSTYFVVALAFVASIILVTVPLRTADAAIAHEESISTNGASTNTVTTGTIQGGTSQLYVVAVGNRTAQNTTSVSGGSLTWTERIDTCSARGSVQGISIWTATGSPSSFTVTVTLAGSSNGIAVTVTRYSGADQTTPVEDVVYTNTLGESGACTGGTDTNSVSLTTGSTTASSTHFVATNARNRTISTADADYTQRATDMGGVSGGDQTRVYAHDYTKVATGDDTAAHTLSATTDWVAAGFVIKPASGGGGGTPTLNQKEYRWYANTNAVQPTTALAAQDSPGFPSSIADVIRLRLGLEVGAATLTASSAAYKLQYSTSTSGPWNDVGTSSGGDWYNSNWQYRKKITIDDTKVSGSGTHSNFPVLVNVSDSDLNTDAQADGDDILFTAADGISKIYHQIETYAAGSLTAWVKVPTLNAAANTDIYMYYGYATVASQASPADVWTDYSVVWHMSEDPSGSSPQTQDSTANNFDGTTNGTMTSGDLVTGKINKAYDFDGTDDYIVRSDPAGGEFDIEQTDVATFSFWVKSTDTSSSYDLVDKGDPGYRVIKRVDGTLNCQFRGSNTFNHTNDSSSIEDNTWRYIACRYDGSTYTSNIFNNGAQEDNSTLDIGHMSGTHPLEVPSANTSALLLMDEFRMAKILRSPDWISTEYNNQNSPATFYSLGLEETSSGSGASVWEFYNNSSVADGAAVTATLLSSSDTYGPYAESNPTAVNPNAVIVGNQGEWDFSLTPGEAVLPETVYYFRMVTSADVALNTYTVYPELCLDVVPEAGNRMVHGAWFKNETKQPYAISRDVTANGCGT